MDIRVSGHQMATGEALQTHVETRLTTMVDKYFSRALSSAVTFGRAPANAFRCDIVMHVMQGLVLKGSGVAPDAHHALDGAAEKIDKQLRRYKRRLTDRHEQAAHAARAEDAATGNVTTGNVTTDNVTTDNAAYVIFEEPAAEADEIVAEAPVVIAETRVDVPEASVSDAVMMLDLRNTTALLFKNAGTGKHNMVYRRGDGSIGWVEPS